MEYKILIGQPSDVQKILNQWKHQYTLDIISMAVNSPPNNIAHREITILLIRQEKTND